MNELVSIILKKKIEILMICGLNDEVSLSQCLEFDKKAKETGLNCKTILIDGFGHEYPDHFREIVSEFL
jgi:vancomycin permeability regulator SanA